MGEYLLLSAVLILKDWEKIGPMQKDGAGVGGWVTQKLFYRAKLLLKH